MVRRTSSPSKFLTVKKSVVADALDCLEVRRTGLRGITTNWAIAMLRSKVAPPDLHPKNSPSTLLTAVRDHILPTLRELR